MKNGNIKLGPLALLLAVISICLTALAILTVSTARADLRLAEKYAQTVTLRCALEAEGQELLSELGSDPEAALADWERDAEGRCWKTLERDGARLTIGLARRADGSYEVIAWAQDKLWVQDTHIANLWNGNEGG